MGTINVVNVLSESSRKTSSARGAEEGETWYTAAGIRGRFRRTARLLRHADFQRVYKQGRRHFGTHMTVFYLNRQTCTSQDCLATQSGPRIGFTVPRALGGAVERNRIKRRMREVVRRELTALTVAADVVINPKKSALVVDFLVLREEVARAFVVIQEKCGSQAADERG